MPYVRHLADCPAIHRAARRGYVALAQDSDAPRGVRLASLTDTGRTALAAL